MAQVQKRLELKIARIRKAMTQEQLAGMLGLKQQAVFNWEAGICRPERTSTLLKIEQILDEPWQKLFPDIVEEALSDGGDYDGQTSGRIA